MVFFVGVLAVIVIVVVIFLLHRSWAPKPGPNPFARDCSKPAQPLVLNHSARDKVLKQGFAVKKIPADLDAIVIGSGIGGLAAANILSKVGKRVLVLEQHDQAGGSCHAFTEKGFEFDVGIHYVGEMHENSLPRVLLDQLTEGQLQWERLVDQFDMYVIGEPGKQKLHPITAGSYDIWKKSLVDIFPEEEDVISKFVDLTKEAAKASKSRVMLKVLPKWVCRLAIGTGLRNKLTDVFKYSNMSTQEVLDGLTDNNALKTLLAYNFGNYGCLPSEASFSLHAGIANHYMNGAFYPRGGSTEIAFHMIPVIEKAGGRVLVRAPVTEILGGNGRVVGVKVQRGKHGEEIEIRAPLVISDAGVVNTFTKLLPQGLANKSSIPKMIGEKLHSGRGCISLFAGLEGTTEELNLQGKNYWTFTSNHIDHDFGEYLKLTLDEAVETDAPSLYITFPSAKDSTYNLRFPGNSVCVVVAPTNWEWFEPWENDTVKKRGADYVTLKNRLKERVWHQTCCLFPQLADKVEYLDMGTPVTNKYYLNAPKGEMYGLDHTTERFSSPDVTMHLRPDTDIPGLFMAGQDVMSCGFVPCAFTGLLCASRVLHRNVFGDLTSLVNQIAKQK